MEKNLTEDEQIKEPECPYADAEDMVEQMFFADEVPNCYKKTDEDVAASCDKLMDELEQEGFLDEEKPKENSSPLGLRYWLVTGVGIALAAGLLLLLVSMGGSQSLFEELRQYLSVG